MKLLILVGVFYSCSSFSRTNLPPSEIQPGPVNYEIFNGDFEGTGACEGNSFTMESSAEDAYVFMPTQFRPSNGFYDEVTHINGPTQTMEASCFSSAITYIDKAVGRGNKVVLYSTYIHDCCLTLNPFCRDKVVARKTQTFIAEKDRILVDVWGQGKRANRTQKCIYRRVR